MGISLQKLSRIARGGDFNGLGRGRSLHFTACFGFCYRCGLRFPNELDAFRFAYDSLDGMIIKPKDLMPFGIHGHSTIELLKAAKDDI
jgi:hypothetical protein